MSYSENDRHKTLHRVRGKLHSVHHLKDDAGRVISTVVRPLKVEFHLEDFGQLVVGAFVLALPLAFTEEVWDLGEDLSGGRIFAIFVASLIALALFIWTLFYQGEGDSYTGHFLKRVVAAYAATFCVALFLMILVDKAPLDDIQLTLSRVIIVSFPASFSATAVDFVK
jgi:uncharacterized membrane protein